MHIQAGVESDDSSATSGALVIGFVASTIPEVRMLVELANEKGAPYNDIVYAIPICKSKLNAIQILKSDLSSSTNSNGSIHLLVDHPDQIEFLEEFISKNSTESNIKWSVFVKVDTGYHRAGVTCDMTVVYH